MTVSADGVTIDGAGEAVLDAADDASGPVVHVVGARGFTLRGVTVQNGQHGVLIERMSTVDLEVVVSRDNRSHGVEVILSHATIQDLHAHGNGRVGLIVNRNSEIRLTDGLLEENGISGIVLFTSAIARLEGRNVVRGNGEEGFTLGQGGKLFTIGARATFDETSAGSVACDDTVLIRGALSCP